MLLKHLAHEELGTMKVEYYILPPGSDIRSDFIIDEFCVVRSNVYTITTLPDISLQTTEELREYCPFVIVIAIVLFL
jgi:hypothetical protein